MMVSIKGIHSVLRAMPLQKAIRRVATGLKSRLPSPCELVKVVARCCDVRLRMTAHSNLTWCCHETLGKGGLLRSHGLSETPIVWRNTSGTFTREDGV